MKHFTTRTHAVHAHCTRTLYTHTVVQCCDCLHPVHCSTRNVLAVEKYAALIEWIESIVFTIHPDVTADHIYNCQK